jgi:hypothetical protein
LRKKYRKEEIMRPAQRLFGGSLLLKLGRAAAIIAVVAAGATTLSSAAASSKMDAAGTLAVTDRAVLMSYRDGKNVVQERLVHRVLTGTFSGSEVAVVHYVIHPDGSATITGADTCTCTIQGRTGTVTFRDRGTVSSAGIIDVYRKSIDSTGGLAGIQATMVITGPVAAPAQTYTGSYEFGDADD